MATEKERLVLELEKAKVELEHEDLLEIRNALLIAEITIPIAVLTLASELHLITNNISLLSFAILAGGAFYFLETNRRNFNERLRSKQARIDELIAEAQANRH